MTLENYPLLKKGTYLNTAYMGLMSVSLSNYRRDYEQGYLNEGDSYKFNADNLLSDTHVNLSNFFGSLEKNTFVIPNFSTGIRKITNYLPFNLNVLLIKDDYPSLVNAFDEKKFNIDSIDIQENLELEIERRINYKKIDVLAISIVQYASGLLIDINFLKKLKSQYPDLIIIGDGTQFLGAHNFDFNSSPFDVVAASGYKWLLAGFGNGVLMISDYYLSRIKKKAFDLHDDIFTGHFNILSVASLNFSIKNFQKNDFNKLIKHKEKLSEKAKKIFSENCSIGEWVKNRKKHSSIFILEGNRKLYKTLIKNKIYCVQRGKGVRVSFHFYNTDKDLDKLIKVIKQ